MSQRGRFANGMLLFLIYGMFALFSLLLVVIGAKVYRDLTTVGEENARIRSIFSYVSNKIRLNPNSKNAKVDVRKDISVLALNESYGDKEYETLIYYYDGAIRELFIPTGKEFKPEMGETIVLAQDLNIVPKDGGVILTLTQPDGLKRDMFISLSNGGGAQ